MKWIKADEKNIDSQIKREEGKKQTWREYIQYWDLEDIKKIIYIKPRVGAKVEKEIQFEDKYGQIWTGAIMKEYPNVGYDIYIY